MLRKRRGKTTGVAPPPVVKIAAPKSAELKEIYKKLVTANITNRISAFVEAIDWWDRAIPAYMTRLPKAGMSSEQLKKLSQAGKSRNLALGAPGDMEKEAAWIRAISLMEKIWSNEHPVSYKTFYDKYTANKVELEKKEANATSKFQVVLDALNSAFQPLALTFHLVKNTNSGQLREYDGEGKILLTIALAKSLNEKVKQEGLLPVLFSEAKTAVIASGVEKINDPDDPSGFRSVPNSQKMVQNLPKAMDGILAYINTAPKGKVFKSYGGALEAVANQVPLKQSSSTKTKTASPGSGRVHAPRGKRTGGSLVGGRYAAGSAMAILYQRLADQKSHSLSDILNGLAVNNPKDRLKYLVKHGQRSGNWSVQIHGNTVQMTIP